MMAAELLQEEFILQRILKNNDTDFVVPGNPNILCTPLPNHWRSNKALVKTFKVFCLTPIPNGTRVVLSAGNTENICAQMRGNESEMRNQVAVFQDLRFLGKSGRGKKFNVTITVESRPPQISLYPNAIKVTVDGPREPRCKTGCTPTATGTVRKEYIKFPSYVPQIITKSIIYEVLSETIKIRRHNLKRLYSMSDEEIEQFVKKVSRGVNVIELRASSSTNSDSINATTTTTATVTDNHHNMIRVIPIDNETMNRIIRQINNNNQSTTTNQNHSFSSNQSNLTTNQIQIILQTNDKTAPSNVVHEKSPNHLSK